MAKTQREVLRMIAEDAENDANSYDGMPLTGKTVAVAFGQTLAMIKALATIVESLLPPDEPVSATDPDAEQPWNDRDAERESLAASEPEVE